MKRKPLLIANWKMHKTHLEAKAFVQELALEPLLDKADVWIAPPFTALEAVVDVSPKIKIGAQNMHYESQGAFTGEISASMLKALGVHFVLLGHSERRHVFKETSLEISRKVKAALLAGLIPVLCVGETLQEHEEGRTQEVLQKQLTQSLEGVELPGDLPFILAYEPVWAIGTGKVATPEIAQSAHSLCQKTLEKIFGRDVACKIPLLYGGSVKPDNISTLLEKELIHGVLVGGASLNLKTWIDLIQEGVL